MSFFTYTIIIMLICRHNVLWYCDVMYFTSMPARCDDSSHKPARPVSMPAHSCWRAATPLIIACIQTGDPVRISASLSSVVCNDCDWLLKPVYF